MSKYDYLIVGAGLYGAIYARQKTDAKKKCLVIDRRDHIAGNIYSEKIEGIEVHKYGPHIFHTDNSQVWEYINRFSQFNHFIYSPVANYRGEFYNLPFNMNTFTKIWPDVKTPEQAQNRVKEQRDAYIKEQKEKFSQFDSDPSKDQVGVVPTNLEEQAISLVGKDIYTKLIKDYTEKQWGRPCSELPPYIIRRRPVRWPFDNNYFNQPYQGIPIDGYTKMIERVLDGIEVQLCVNYMEHRDELRNLAETVVFTGPIDEY